MRRKLLFCCNRRRVPRQNFLIVLYSSAILPGFTLSQYIIIVWFYPAYIHRTRYCYEEEQKENSGKFYSLITITIMGKEIIFNFKFQLFTLFGWSFQFQLDTCTSHSSELNWHVKVIHGKQNQSIKVPGLNKESLCPILIPSSSRFGQLSSPCEFYRSERVHHEWLVQRDIHT